MKIAVITPKYKDDYLTNTVLDGLMQLPEHKYVKSGDASFLEFAKTADLVFFFWGKDNTDFEMAEKIARWERTIFIDGSELGRNRRYDTSIQQKVLEGTYDGKGAIDKNMLKKCLLYFRREKPYTNGVIPLPFGIESKYTSHFSATKEKDIDFACIFGQDEYPIMRREVRKHLEKFCKKNGFTCATNKTSTPNEFYEILSRSKVGISVGGGGFDTARFWEILGNNCLLMTEKMDIFEEGSQALKYDRIYEFENLEDFDRKLDEVASFLKNGYDYRTMNAEYARILEAHSSVARVNTILNHAKLHNL